MTRRLLPVFFAAFGLASCGATTGGDLVSFEAAFAGPQGVRDHAMSFTTGRGLEVRLTKATLVVGAVYMNRTAPIAVAQEKRCISRGTYVGEVTGGAHIDLLSGVAQRGKNAGVGTTERAVTGEVWLTGGDVDAVDDPTTVAEVEGEVTLGGTPRPFRGSVSFGANRRAPAVDPARPSAAPPCRERIVSPIPIDVTPSAGGLLTVRIDPRGWFAVVPFDDLADVGGVLTFDDANTNASSIGLAIGVRTPRGVTTFEWSPNP